jgi:uncharacterized Zn finger protein (UPF0148 family)
MSRWTGAYRCNLCSQVWTEDAGPVYCPRCGQHESIKWLNFEKLRADHPWHATYPERAR